MCGNSCSVCRLSSRPNIGTISTRFMRRENPQENLRSKYGLDYVHHKDAALFGASSRTNRIAHAVHQYLKSPAPYCQRSVGMSPRKFPHSTLDTRGSLQYSTVCIWCSVKITLNALCLREILCSGTSGNAQAILRTFARSRS